MTGLASDHPRSTARRVGECKTNTLEGRITFGNFGDDGDQTGLESGMPTGRDDSPVGAYRTTQDTLVDRSPLDTTVGLSPTPEPPVDEDVKEDTDKLSQNPLNNFPIVVPGSRDTPPPWSRGRCT